ncbi:MAG: hypothetical protein R3D58_13545 [Saprospiraceae bacterium]
MQRLNALPIFIVLLLWAGVAGLPAQIPALVSGEVQLIKADDEKFQDFEVPKLDSLDQLIFELEGGDGGWVEYAYYDRFNTLRTQRVGGGEGATVSAGFRIGNGSGDIPRGAILRLIIGKRGEWAKHDLLDTGNYGAGGGGGTTVLMSKDNRQSWTVLLVASGGGGAGVQKTEKGIFDSPGLPGNPTDNGTGSGMQQNIASGGSQGQGGQFVQSSGGGGGAFGDGIHEPGALYYGNAGWKDKMLYKEPLGGVGGTQAGARNGGWGFGGGGSGGVSGGGGGGYSGGGAGKAGFGGGGGGSFIESISVSPFNASRQNNGSTINPGDGYVRYMLTKKSP